jgi:hypothetical protein
MENSQKERIERELRFLKGSLDAGIISRDEYEKGVQRIEKKKSEREEKEETKSGNNVAEKPAEEITVKEITEGGIEEEPTKEETVAEEVRSESSGDVESQKREDVESQKSTEEKDVEDWMEKTTEEVKEKKPTRIKKKHIWALLIIIAIAIIFFNISKDNGGNEEVIEPLVEEVGEETFIACYSDSDCEEEGQIGVCYNPGMESASCEFMGAVKIDLTVVNDKNCASCDTSRMFGVVKDLFPGVEVRSVEYDSLEGRRLVSMYGIDALPTYIFEDNVNETLRFDLFKQALMKRRGSYIIRNSASGANYYFKREEIPNKLELFTLSEENIELDNSLKEVSNLFGSQIEIVRTLVTDGRKTTLEKQLGITTYPTFLVNNQLKFGGIQPPETIKNKFCELNNLDKCSTALSAVIP